MFNSSKCNDAFWTAVIEALRDSEQIALDDFVKSDSSAAHHSIDFSKTIEPNGFKGIDDEQLPSLQFAVGEKSQGWRVYGYVSSQRFYIIWLDPEHSLYSKGGA